MAGSLNLSNYSNIQQAAFVKIYVPEYGTLRMSTYDLPFNITESDGQSYTYTPMGILLGISEFNNELSPSKNDVTISLAAIDQSFVAGMMGYNLKGSKVSIRRAFFDASNSTLLPIAGNPSLRFTGIIANYSFNDEYNQFSNTASTTVSVSCSSIVTVLDQKFAGQITSDSDRRYHFDDDYAFSRVATIANSVFDFGKPYTGNKTQTTL